MPRTHIPHSYSFYAVHASHRANLCCLLECEVAVCLLCVCRREPNLIFNSTVFLHWLPVYGNCIIGCVFVCVFATSWGQDVTVKTQLQDNKPMCDEVFVAFPHECVRHQVVCEFTRASKVVCLCASTCMLRFLNSLTSMCLNVKRGHVRPEAPLH